MVMNYDALTDDGEVTKSPCEYFADRKWYVVRGSKPGVTVYYLARFYGPSVAEYELFPKPLRPNCEEELIQHYGWPDLGTAITMRDVLNESEQFTK